MRYDPRTAVVTASPDGLFWPGRRLLQKRFATASVEPGSGTAAAARSVVGSLRGRIKPGNWPDRFGSVPISARVRAVWCWRAGKRSVLAVVRGRSRRNAKTRTGLAMFLTCCSPMSSKV
jgi:hypothetical protein